MSRQKTYSIKLWLIAKHTNGNWDQIIFEVIDYSRRKRAQSIKAGLFKLKISAL